MRTTNHLIQLLATACIVIATLAGCSHDKEIITKASLALESRDYNAALKEILLLDDDAIIKSDTMMQLLATAFYGQTMNNAPFIAGDCYDIDFFDNNRNAIVTDFSNGALTVFSFPEMESLRSIQLPSQAYNIDISPSDSLLAAAMTDNTIRVYDLKNEKDIKILSGHSARVRDVVFKDDSTLFSCGNDGCIAAWDLKTTMPLWVRRLNAKNTKSLQLSADKSKLITASNDGTASIINTADTTGRELLRVVHGENYVNDAALSPDGRQLVTASGDGWIKFWDATTGRLLKEWFFNNSLCSLNFSPDGSRIIVGGDANVYILDAATAKTITKIHGLNMPFWTVGFIGDNEIFFADNSRFWHHKFLTGRALVEEARKTLQ